MKVITKDLNFLSKRNISSISKYKESLEKYSKDFENEASLKTNTPIILDTNVLLRYYSISFTAREKLYEFIKDNSKRIILTTQVQYEFLKNREDVIQRFFEQVTNKIPKDFNSDVVNKMKGFIETHKVVLKDYPFVESGIQKHQNELEELLNKLNDTSEQKRKDHTDLIFKDPFLDLLNSCGLYEGLIDDEIKIVKDDFDSLSKSITSDNIDAVLNKPNSAFPGLGDIRNKPEDPYGDYIIFHEIMKYMISNKTNTIFLTFDNTKGDWMSKSKSPHLNYIQNMYANTNQVFYVLDAERTLGEILNVNIASLVSTDNKNVNDVQVTVESLANLFETHRLFEGLKAGLINERLVKELDFANYKTIQDIKRDLARGASAVLEYKRKKNPSLNTAGMLRACLRIVNPSYNYTLTAEGDYKPLEENFLARYDDYRSLVQD